MRRARAFTMMEAMVCLALMAIVSSAAISAFAAFSRLSKHAEREAVLIETVRAGLAYVTAEVRLAGGVGLLPWASVIVEDNCRARGDLPECRGSDRLTLVQGIPTFPGCRVIENRENGDLVFERVDLGCCFNDAGPGRFVRQIALIKDDVMQPVVLVGKGSCVFERRPIIPDPLLPRPPTGDWRDAIAVLADVKTFYVDWKDVPAGQHAEGALTMHIELDGDDEVVGERMTILERVADFQAALGYDVGDGLDLEQEDGRDGWWPGNEDETGPSPMQPEKARFVGFSVIGIGGDGGGPPTLFAQTPWGPTRTLNSVIASTGTERLALPQE